ncbi:MAG: ATP-binding protein [Chloroflexi bacterium]|nr:ATP-binding protein [Chloroflexota bacterium]
MATGIEEEADCAKDASPLISTPAQLFTVLGRDPNELVGQPETSWLDFKGEPYLLDDSHAGRRVRERLELAKDVTALANANGGVLLLGVATETDASAHEEIAKALRPIPAGAVNPKQLQDLIWEWVQPKLDVEIQSHPVEESSGNLWSILVQPQQERDRPFIVAGELVGEALGANRNLFGVYVRVGSQNSPYPTWQVQQWINAGWRRAIAEEVASSEVALSLPEAGDAVLADDVKSIGANRASEFG